jgi:hypothetical protein
VARALKKDDALIQLERWKERYPSVAARLEPADVLVDSMRGRSSTWTRVRINLQHVPVEERPAEPIVEGPRPKAQGPRAVSGKRR